MLKHSSHHGCDMSITSITMGPIPRFIYKQLPQLRCLVCNLWARGSGTNLHTTSWHQSADMKAIDT